MPIEVFCIQPRRIVRLGAGSARGRARLKVGSLLLGLVALAIPGCSGSSGEGSAGSNGGSAGSSGGSPGSAGTPSGAGVSSGSGGDTNATGGTAGSGPACEISDCGDSGFTYSCGSPDTQMTTEDSCLAAGRFLPMQVVVSYASGHTVTCRFNRTAENCDAMGGECVDDTGASCSFGGGLVGTGGAGSAAGGASGSSGNGGAGGSAGSGGTGCPATLTRCEPSCVDLESNLFHCGECGRQCPPGTTCQVGECECPLPELRLCGEDCVPIEVDLMNCGECDNICTQGQTCMGGECVPP